MKNSFVVPFNISDYLPRNTKEISKDLRVPINEDYLNEIRSMTSYASSNVLNTFPPESIKELRRSVQSLSASYLPVNGSTSSLKKSLINFSSLFTSDIRQPISSQMFDDTLASMRYYTSTNNHIKLQWENLINTRLNDEFINSFMNLTDVANLSSSLGISEDKLRFMQKVIDSDNQINTSYAPTEPNNNVPENSSASKHLKNNHQQTDNIKNKKYQNISPTFLIWLFIFVVPVLVYTDGSIRNNELEQKISTGIEMTMGAIKSASELSNKNTN